MLHQRVVRNSILPGFPAGKWGFLLLCFFLLNIEPAIAQTSTPVIVGYRDFAYGGIPDGEITGEKPESKLWWNDGRWWACMWDVSASRYRIYRYNPGNPPGWTNTGVGIDDRPNTKADVLWDGQKLYVASHYFSGTNSGVTTSDPAQWTRLYRYSYAGGAYTLDANFPTFINNATAEALTIDKDSGGKLWAAWAENNNVKVNCSTDGGITWLGSFTLPVQGAKLNPDDIAALAAFGGNKIGVMWSNQNDKKMYFAFRNDSDPHTTWQPREAALVDATLIDIADDHINLKAASDGSGNLYAVTKTSLTGAGKPLNYLLKRTSAGVWSRHQVWATEDQTTRAIMAIDSTHRRVYAFARSLADSAGVVYMKSAHLDTLLFPAGLGAPFIQSAVDFDVNNVTSTKQSVGGVSSLLVLASDKTTDYYLHNYINLKDATPPVIASFTPAAGPAGITVTIQGSSFSGSTALAFNGAADTTFQVLSDSLIQATVPDSASTGPISITNAVGTGYSSESFVVTTPPYTLSYYIIGPGTLQLDPPGGNYDSVTTVTLAAIPDSGYVFSGWSGDLSGSANPDSLLMNDDKTITATFIPQGGIGGETIVHKETKIGGTSGFTTIATFEPLTAVNGDLYLAAFAPRPAVPIVSVSGLGLTWTRVLSQCADDNSTSIEIWKARGTPTASGPVSAVLSGVPFAAVMAASRYSGVDTLNPIGNTVSGNSLGVNGLCNGNLETELYSFNINASVDGAVIFGAAAMRNKRHYPGDGYKERAEYSEGTAGNVAGIAVVDRTFPEAMPAVLNGTLSSPTDWAVIGLELKPQGAINAHSLALGKTGSGSGSIIADPPTGTYPHGASVALTAAPDSGSVFSGWSGDLAGVQNPDTLLMDDEKTVIAEFTRRYVLQLDTAGSGGITLNPPPVGTTANGDAIYNAGTSVVLGAEPDSAFAFRGWSGDLNGLENPDTLLMNADKAVSVSFIRQFHLAVETVGRGSVALHPAPADSGSSGFYDSLSVVTLLAVPDSGYVFRGWSGDLASADTLDSILVDSDKSVTATFVRQFTLTLDTLIHGMVLLDPPPASGDSTVAVYDSATVVALTAVPDSGYGFKEWSGDLSGNANPDSLLMDTARQVGAGFVRQFTLSLEALGAGTVLLDPPPVSRSATAALYDSATVVVLTAIADSANAFRGWSGDLVGMENPDTLVIDSDKQVSARFVRRFTVSLAASGSGDIQLDPPGGVYDSATVVVLTATADSAYAFRGWSGDLGGQANPDTLIVDSDKQIAAAFVRQFSLTLAANGPGAILADPPGSVYDSAAAVVLTAVPDAGYIFSGWSGGLNSPQNPDTLLMDADKTVTATFSQQLGVTVNARLFLEGAYLAQGAMRTTLADNGWIPLEQPFNAAPWHYPGDETVESLPEEVVDWVLLALRTSPEGSNETYRAAFLKRDGTVADIGGAAPVSFVDQAPGEYYIVVYHRNHLAVMSNSAVELNANSLLYDFSADPAMAYGTGALKELDREIYGMYCGDANADGRVTQEDKELFWRPQNGTAWEYGKYGDLNLDGGIDVKDLNLCWRYNIDQISQVPEAAAAAAKPARLPAAPRQGEDRARGGRQEQ